MGVLNNTVPIGLFGLKWPYVLSGLDVLDRESVPHFAGFRTSGKHPKRHECG
jgi:hypothetical protein